MENENARAEGGEARVPQIRGLTGAHSEHEQIGDVMRRIQKGNALERPLLRRGDRIANPFAHEHGIDDARGADARLPDDGLIGHELLVDARFAEFVGGEPAGAVPGGA